MVLTTRIAVGRIRMIILIMASKTMMRFLSGRRIPGLAIFKFNVRPAVVVHYPV